MGRASVGEAGADGPRGPVSRVSVRLRNNDCDRDPTLPEGAIAHRVPRAAVFAGFFRAKTGLAARAGLHR